MFDAVDERVLEYDIRKTQAGPPGFPPPSQPPPCEAMFQRFIEGLECLVDPFAY